MMFIRFVSVLIVVGRIFCDVDDLVDVCYTSAENKPEHCQFLDFDDVVEQSGYLHVGHAIKKLTISNKKILNIPTRMFKALPSLQSFVIVNCILYREIDPNTIQEAKTLERLEISLTNVTILESHLFPGARNLKQIFFHHNQISEIKNNAFDNFEKLEEINLSYNKLDRLEDGIFQIHIHLKSIDLNHNQLKVLNYDDWFRHGITHYINHLDVSYNNITELKWKELPAKKLNLKYNELSEISLDGNCTDLYASYNKISRFFVRGNCTLEKLSLSNNQLFSLRPIQNCSETLRSLDVSFNFLDPSTDFPGMKQLTGLNLECTNVSIVYKTLIHSRKLKFLDISYNNISTLKDVDLSAQKMLERLMITGNPISEVVVDDIRKEFPSLKTIGIYDLGWDEIMFSKFIEDLKRYDIKPFIKSDHIFEESACPLRVVRHADKDIEHATNHSKDDDPEASFISQGSSKAPEYVVIFILLCVICGFIFKTFIDSRYYRNLFRNPLSSSISHENLVHCDITTP